jgi:TetR/AcrR family transcriptional regulator, transcriptional repressor for nem operon
MATAIFNVKSFLRGSSLKVTKKRVGENREALVQAAGRLFRERGIDGVGVAEISKSAGLTHGALYAQFPSKGALAAEAFASGLKPGMEKLSGRAGRSAAVAAFLDDYLSIDHRDNLAGGCPMSASASEIARQEKTVCERYTEGFEQAVALIERGLGAAPGKPDKRERAMAIMAAMIGGVAVSRAVAKADPKLANQILRAVRQIVGEVDGEGAPATRKRAG